MLKQFIKDQLLFLVLVIVCLGLFLKFGFWFIDRSHRLTNSDPEKYTREAPARLANTTTLIGEPRWSGSKLELLDLVITDQEKQTVVTCYLDVTCRAIEIRDKQLKRIALRGEPGSNNGRQFLFNCDVGVVGENGSITWMCRP